MANINPGFWLVDVAFLESELGVRLAEELKVCIHAAAMYRALLYGWAVLVKVKPDGNLMQFRSRKIEEACRWSGKPGDLIEAFKHAGVMAGDHDNEADPLVIVDWQILSAHVFKTRKSNSTAQATYRGKSENTKSKPRRISDEVSPYVSPYISDEVSNGVSAPIYDIESNTQYHGDLVDDQNDWF